MNKAIMLSIAPKWCELIASGKKTIEVRKTRPAIDTPFKCYIYCTNTRPYLVWGDVFRGNWETEFTHLVGYGRKEAERIWDVFNGRVMGEFVCDDIEKLTYNFDGYGDEWHEWNDEYVDYKDMCLSEKELEDYLGANNGYGWHISDLKIYDKPKDLGEFFKDIYGKLVPLKRPFQSWGYVEEL